MIVTCASCLTKFNLDETRIPAKGAKVRCSRCQHVFFIVPPAKSQEEQEPVEDFETFARQHEDLIGPSQAETEPPSQASPEEEERVAVEEEPFPFPDRTAARKGERVTHSEFGEEEKAEAKIHKRKGVVPKERKGPSLIFVLIIILALLVLGGFYLWTELGSKGKLSSYLEFPVKRVTSVWDQLLGRRQEGLIVGDLNRYDEKAGEFSLSVIEGKVINQSRSAKKYIKIKVVIFDQNKDKVAEKETLCGLGISREDLKNLPPDFFKGEMLVQPQLAKEMIIPPGKDAPFMVIFKDLSGQAKEFKVEVSDAPDL